MHCCPSCLISHPQATHSHSRRYIFFKAFWKSSSAGLTANGPPCHPLPIIPHTPAPTPILTGTTFSRCSGSTLALLSPPVGLHAPPLHLVFGTWCLASRPNTFVYAGTTFSMCSKGTPALGSPSMDLSPTSCTSWLLPPTPRGTTNPPTHLHSHPHPHPHNPHPHPYPQVQHSQGVLEAPRHWAHHQWTSAHQPPVLGAWPLTDTPRDLQ